MEEIKYKRDKIQVIIVDETVKVEINENEIDLMNLELSDLDEIKFDNMKKENMKMERIRYDSGEFEMELNKKARDCIWNDFVKLHNEYVEDKYVHRSDKNKSFEIEKLVQLLWAYPLTEHVRKMTFEDYRELVYASTEGFEDLITALINKYSYVIHANIK